MGAGADRAVRALAAGRVVVYPTDTLLGFGVRATDTAAVDRLTALKGRPGGLPISVAVSSLEEVEPLVRLTAPGRAFLRRALPGPYTVLLPASAEARRTLAPAVLGPTGTLGVRVPDHPAARELARRAGPVTATSVNRHGAPPCRSVAAARREFGHAVAVYWDAPPRPSGRPSMLVDLTRAAPRFVARK